MIMCISFYLAVSKTYVSESTYTIKQNKCSNGEYLDDIIRETHKVFHALR